MTAFGMTGISHGNYISFKMALMLCVCRLPVRANLDGGKQRESNLVTRLIDDHHYGSDDD